MSAQGVGMRLKQTLAVAVSDRLCETTASVCGLMKERMRKPIHRKRVQFKSVHPRQLAETLLSTTWPVDNTRFQF